MLPFEAKKVNSNALSEVGALMELLAFENLPSQQLYSQFGQGLIKKEHDIATSYNFYSAHISEQTDKINSMPVFGKMCLMRCRHEWAISIYIITEMMVAGDAAKHVLMRNSK